MSVTVQLSHVIEANVVLPFTVTGTASDSVDYTITASPVTIPAGSLTTTITITLIDDDLNEDDETVVISMGTPTNASKGTPDVHTATIFDTDPMPKVAFFITGSSGGESVSTVNLMVRLSAASGLPISVRYGVSGGTASKGIDFFLLGETLHFEPGETLKSVVLKVLDDSIDELSETVIVTLSEPSNASLGLAKAFTYTILDDDPTPSPYP